MLEETSTCTPHFVSHSTLTTDDTDLYYEVREDAKLDTDVIN